MKQQRHATIRELLEGAPIASQDDLRRRLAKRGHHVTQATLSRDIRELRLAKGPLGYVVQTNPSAVNDDPPSIREMLRSFALEARQALHLLVLITSTGGAQPVAAGIDYEGWPEVVGTIAGDDTVLIICPDQKRAHSLRTRIEGYLA